MSDERDIKPAPLAQPEVAAVKDGGGGGEAGDHVQERVGDMNLDAEKAAHEGQEEGIPQQGARKIDYGAEGCPSSFTVHTLLGGLS